MSEDYCVIPLTRGCVAWVDREDYEAVSAHKWNAMVHKNIVYAVRHRPGSEGGILYMHREILAGCAVVDHRHHPPGVADNRRRNLRPATVAQNVANARKMVGTRSIFKGVAGTAGKSSKPWRAVIVAAGKQRSLGYFLVEAHAALAYDLAAVALHGPHALTNFPVPGSGAWIYG